MLKASFQWLDGHPLSYWWPAGFATFLLAGQIWCAIRREDHGAKPSALCSLTDTLILFLFIFAWRWPFLLAADAFNPDESQLIAGSITLAHDPIFWRSVDGTTSGPLNFYLLLPYSWLGFPLDYFIARLTGLLLVVGALLASQKALAENFGRAVAWMAILPAAGFFATATHPDLIHYSSEHLTFFLVAIAILLLAAPDRATYPRVRMASFVAGAMIWAKLQAAPLSVALVCWALWLDTHAPGLTTKDRWKRTAGTVLFALAPTLIVAALSLATDQTAEMFRRYFLQNLFYVGNAQPFTEAIRGMNQMAAIDGRLNLLLGTSGLILVSAAVYFLIRHRRPPGLCTVALFLTLAALVAVLAPRREFLHYALLLPVPLTLLVGAAVGGVWAELSVRPLGRVVAGLLFLAAGVAPLITRMRQPLPETYGRFAYDWSHPRAAVAMIARNLAGRNERIAIWGWAADVYVESQLPQATRDTHSTWSIIPNEQSSYYRNCYLDDLRLRRPPVFIDAVGPGAFVFELRAIQAHEIFPELEKYIRQNYTLVTDLISARIYARNDLPALRELTPARILALRTRSRMKDQQRMEVTPALLTRIDELTQKTIAKQQLILIPAKPLEWPLDENVREVALEFGFDPATGGKSRNKRTGVFLELVNDYGSQTLFHQFLDPAHQREDRQFQTVLVPLPAFTPGTHLLLRNDADVDDDSSDPIYLANVQFRLGPPARR